MWPPSNPAAKRTASKQNHIEVERPIKHEFVHGPFGVRHPLSNNCIAQLYHTRKKVNPFFRLLKKEVDLLTLLPIWVNFRKI